VQGLGSPERIAKARWPEDEVTLALLTRAAASPATTTTSGWASQLATTAVADFVASLAPQSAAAALFAKAMQVPLNGASSVSIPRRNGVPASVDAAWVAEGSPHPVVQFSLTASTLGPMKKMVLSTACTRETVLAGGEPVMRQLLRETVAATLDATVLGSAAATSAKPAGLRAGVTPITASASTDRFEAIVADMGALTSAIVAAGGGENIVFVVPPTQATFLGLIGSEFSLRGVTVLQTTALPAGTVMAVDASALATAFGAEPQFQSSIESVVHFDDASPALIVTGGAVPAGSVRSAYQSDLVLTKVTLDAAWTLRAPVVAVAENVGW
jgi:hypothetical protein